MRKLEGYLENPFDNLNVSEDKIKKFFSDHGARFHKAVENGEPYDDLITDTDSVLDRLNKAHSTTVTTRTQLKSRTTTVDEVMKLFKDKILECEPLVLNVFKKKTSAAYIEFFPQGRQGYTRMTKGNIDTLFDQVILAFTHHKDAFGEAKIHEFEEMKAQYDEARKTQIGQKKDTSGSSNSWDDALKAMSDQAFINLQRIAINHRGHPERISQYFDQSILANKHYAPDDNTGMMHDASPDVN